VCVLRGMGALVYGGVVNAFRFVYGIHGWWWGCLLCPRRLGILGPLGVSRIIGVLFCVMW
jgi:hypothetical protein